MVQDRKTKNAERNEAFEKALLSMHSEQNSVVGQSGDKELEEVEETSEINSVITSEQSVDMPVDWSGKDKIREVLKISFNLDFEGLPAVVDSSGWPIWKCMVIFGESKGWNTDIKYLKNHIQNILLSYFTLEVWN